MFELPLGLVEKIWDNFASAIAWIRRYGRSKSILIVGQGRAGKTSLFNFISHKLLQNCSANIPYNSVANEERMSVYEEESAAGNIKVEIRIMKDLVGQFNPIQQGDIFIDSSPHVLFVFLRYNLSLKANIIDPNNVFHWATTFFKHLSDSPRSLRNLCRITFIITYIPDDFCPAKDPKKAEFDQLFALCIAQLPAKIQANISKDIYFMNMCLGPKTSESDLRHSINQMLVESFVHLR